MGEDLLRRARLQKIAQMKNADADGNIFSYEVAEIETVGGYDIEKMEAGDWDLTLFTCTNNGKARAAVRCREIEE